ncbi:MAG: hypothetical protein J5712_08270, partial [Lachnospiraceae bacterium]|nr:hypothetical protein [Lachnospiraceae bacterium]
WQIIKYDETEGRVLLLNKNIIEFQDHIDIGYDDSWEHNPLRKWLNTDFLENAFSDSERSLMRKTLINNADKENDTEDYVFLLSLSEVKEMLMPVFDDKRIWYEIGCDNRYLFADDFGWIPSVGWYTRDDCMLFPFHENTIAAGIRPAFWLYLNP